MLFATMGQLFFITVGGFLGGVLFRSFFDWGLFFVLGIAVTSIAFLGSLFFITGGKQRIVLLVGVFLLATSFGILRVDGEQLWRNNSELHAVAQKNVIAEGVVVDEPDVRDTHTKLIVRIDRVGGDDLSRGGKVLIITEQYPQFSYGDRVLLVGRLVAPENREKELNEPGRAFDYVSFLAKDRIFYEMFYPKVRLIGEGEGNSVRASLLSLKQKFLDAIGRSVPEPHASLLGGIVFGAKQALGPELLDTFRVVGIIHIVVLSGYNMTIVADGLGRVVSFAPRMIGLLLSGAGILSFVVMAGAGATVIRAGVMALLILFARATGRIYDATIGLCLAAFGMVLWNPMILAFDASFQLSFLATVGLMYLATHVERFFVWIPKRFGFRDFAVATVATQIFVLPMLLYMTGLFSLVALPVNMLVLLVIPLIMFLGFMIALFGMAGALFAAPFSLVAFVLLEYILRVAHFFDRFSWSALAVPTFPFFIVVLLYIAYGTGILFLQKRKAYLSM